MPTELFEFVSNQTSPPAHTQQPHPKGWRGVNYSNRDALAIRHGQSACILRAGTKPWSHRLKNWTPQGGAMPIAQDLIERARMFEKRAEQARDPISRRHYKEMAAHYRALSVEHLEIKPEHESAH
jgi:hypothetical protein